MDVTGLAAASLGAMSSTVLLKVATDRPAALLFVDLATAQIVQASALAAQLAPGLELPVAVDTWARAAGVQDPRQPGGPRPGDLPWLTTELTAGAGRVVTMGRSGAVLVEDADEEGLQRSYFVVHLPVDGVDGLQGQVVVIFLPLHAVGTAIVPSQGPGQGQGQGAARYLTDQAVLVAGCSFSLASASGPDLPLTWVNEAFTTLTGYLAAEVVGRNCRFLQGPGTEPEQTALLHGELAAGRDVTAVLLNYRKDGTAFYNQLSVTPVRDASGRITHYFGIQTDVTDRVEADAARRSALTAEQAARADADSARRQAHVLGLRMSLVAEATGLLASTLDVDESLDRLARLAVPLLADWVVITLIDERGRTTGRSIIRHRDGRDDLLERYRRLMPDLAEPTSALYAVRAGGPAHLTPRWSAHAAPTGAPVASTADQELLGIEVELGSTSRVLVPLTARRKVVGTMLLVHGPSGRMFDEGDLELAADLGLRAGLAIDNARMYTREQATAVELQRSLLPSLPVIDGLEIAADYLPAGQGSQVGGDWWDVFLLPDGAIGLAVGDVMGHDIAAAAAMGQLRSVLRTCAWSGEGPAAVLTRMDQLVQSFDLAQLASCFYARIEPAEVGAAPGSPARVTWSSAGHLPPVVQAADGTCRLLSASTDVPIGVPYGGSREQYELTLAHGSTVLLYTDGLVETRAGDIDSDVQLLCDKVAAHPPAEGPQALVEYLVAGLTHLTDDVALLAARLLR